MSTRYYPLFQRGNPQLRVFLPNFWMKIIKPKEPLPPNYVLFQTSVEMTKYDIRNYLEKIYKVPVVEVRTSIKQGNIRKALLDNYLVKDDDFREALVILPRSYKFEYPCFAYDQNLEREKKEFEDSQAKAVEGYKKGPPGLPQWFLY